MIYGTRLHERRVRLLSIELDTYRAPIRCRLLEKSLDDPPLYEALSYVWGDPEFTEPITCNGQIMHVTINLARALRRIRLGISPPDDHPELGVIGDQEIATSQDLGHTTSSSPSNSKSGPTNPSKPYRPCFLWVDAICINQSDIIERNAQVRLMREIYSNAMRVIIWLGDMKSNMRRMMWLKDAADYIRATVLSEECPLDRISEGIKEDKVLSLPMESLVAHMKSGWSDLRLAISAGFSSNWFTRAWCEQEAILAQRKLLLYRNAEISSVAAAMFSAWFTFHAIDRTLLVGQIWHNLVSQARQNLGQCITRLLPRGAFDGVLEPANILHYARNLVVTEPRDKFYGLLGILGAESVEIDYTRSIAGVYTDCALHALRSGLCVLTLISNPIEYDEHKVLPSWVPNLNQDVATIPMQYFRLGEDLRAASDRPLPGIDVTLARNGTLRLAGIWCDTIGSCSELLVNSGQSTLPELFTTLWSELETSSSASKLSLARTLTGGRTLRWLSSPDRPDSLEQFLEDFMAFAGRFIPDTVKVNAVHGTAEGDANAYLSLVDLSLLERRFFRTQKTWPGLGPGCMREHDIVVVFHGGTSPYVLRPIKGREDYYHLMGECYVDNLMDEGAYGMTGEDGVEERIFYLV